MYRRDSYDCFAYDADIDIDCPASDAAYWAHASGSTQPGPSFSRPTTSCSRPSTSSSTGWSGASAYPSPLPSPHIRPQVFSPAPSPRQMTWSIPENEPMHYSPAPHYYDAYAPPPHPGVEPTARWSQPSPAWSSGSAQSPYLSPRSTASPDGIRGRSSDASSVASQPPSASSSAKKRRRSPPRKTSSGGGLVFRMESGKKPARPSDGFIVSAPAGNGSTFGVFTLDIPKHRAPPPPEDYGPTQLPPMGYGPADHPYSRPPSPQRVVESALAQLPALEKRCSALEKDLDGYVARRAQRALQNAVLDGLEPLDSSEIANPHGNCEPRHRRSHHTRK